MFMTDDAGDSSAIAVRSQDRGASGVRQRLPGRYAPEDVPNEPTAKLRARRGPCRLAAPYRLSA